MPGLRRLRTNGASACRVSVALAAALALAGCGDDGGATVSFDSPADGAKVAGGVDVAMLADGVVIEPAGEVNDGAGHFHVIADAGCAGTGDAIGKDADHVHFGSGVSSGTVYLGPGTHTLCLQVGDGQHAALDITDSVEVEVGVTSRDEYCDVVEEVDALVSSQGDHDFATAQAATINAGRLVEQLAAAAEHVDAGARSDVAQLVRLQQELLDAYASAETQAEAEAASWGPDGVMAGYTEDELDAIEGGADMWIRNTCGLSVLD